MDDSILYKILDHAWVAIMGLGGYVLKGMHDDVRELRGSRDHCEIELHKFKTEMNEKCSSQSGDLERFKTEVAKTYATDTSMRTELIMVNERIGKLSDIIENRTSEIARDIKVLLQRGK